MTASTAPCSPSRHRSSISSWLTPSSENFYRPTFDPHQQSYKPTTGRLSSLIQRDVEESARRGVFHATCSVGLRSTEHRLTLHGASVHAPRSIGSRSTEHRREGTDMSGRGSALPLPSPRRGGVGGGVAKLLVFIESQTPPLTPPHGGEGNRGLRSTEHRPTLHGASVYAPRSIGRHSVLCKTAPLVCGLSPLWCLYSRP